MHSSGTRALYLRQSVGFSGRLLDPLTQDACSFYGDHALLDDYTGVVVDMDEGERLAQTLGDKKAII